MGRKVAIPVHAGLSIAAGVLYYFFVLPRWDELLGDTSHGVGTTLRIITAVVIALAALPVVFTLSRTRKPELGNPQLALSLQTWSIVGHVLAGVLILGTAISEVWVSLDAGGRWLFGIYGAAAAIAVLGFFAFYLSFLAELPPPPPKPIKPKKERQRRLGRRKAADETDEDADEDTDEDVEESEDVEEADEADAAEAEDIEVAEAQTVAAEIPEAETQEAKAPEAKTVEAKTVEAKTPAAEDVETAEAPRPALRNRRPSGKASHRLPRKRTRGGVGVDEKDDD
jgi:hypothetical protein